MESGALWWFLGRCQGWAVKSGAFLQSAPTTDTNSYFGKGLRAVRFNLIDKVERIDGDSIVAVKYVSLAEEYLGDHFPTFPVLPGVLMLEAATQAAAWVLHQRTDFGKSVAVLKEARNVKYGHFVAPGNFLRLTVELAKPTDGGAVFKAAGTVGAEQAFTARLELSYFNLADKNPTLAELDGKLTEHNRLRWQVLNATGVPTTLAEATA